MNSNTKVLREEWTKAAGELLAALNSSPPRLYAAAYLRLWYDVAFRAWQRAKEAEENKEREKGVQYVKRRPGA